MTSHTIQVHLTNRCNMKCPYCYIHQNTADMTLDDFKAQFAYIHTLSKLIDPSFGIEGWNIAYFGGEPLMNIDAIRDINDFLRTTDVKINFQHIQTNALLMTRELVDELGQRGIGWSYSYDGVWDSAESIEVHERLLKEGLINRYAKIMIAPEHVGRIVENYQYFVDHGWTNPDLSFVRDIDWTDEAAQVCAQQVTSLVDLMIDQTLADVGQGDRCFCAGFIQLALMDMVVNKRIGKRDYTCHAGRNGYAFTPARVVYPCSRFYHNELYPLLDANTGEVFTGNIEHLSTALNTHNMPDCSDCAIEPYCNTGCAYTQLCCGDYKCMRPVKAYCTVLRHVYSETLRYFNALKHTAGLKELLNDKLGGFFNYG